MHTKCDALRNQRIAWFCGLQIHACIHMCIYICMCAHTYMQYKFFSIPVPVALTTFVHNLEEK